MRDIAAADRITAVGLVIFGFGVAAESWRMPRFTDYGTSIWSSPGLVPGMVGAALTVMGVLLFLRARRVRPSAPLASADADERPDRLGVVIALGLCLAFAAGLVGRVPFILATFLFVAAFTVVFDLRDARRGDLRRRLLRGALALGIAALSAWAIATVFSDVFYVRLP